MSTIPATSAREAFGHPVSSQRRSVLLVFCCTVVGAAAQLLMKVGMARLVFPERHDWFSWLLAMAAAFVADLPLFSGYALYGLNTVLLVLALREGELSMLYPIIALTYVWVTLLSYALLGEPANAYKNAGIAVIVIGVAVLGRGGKPAARARAAAEDRA